MVEEKAHQPGGWANHRAFPLLVSNVADHALVKLQAERNLTRGKALNVVINEGLMALGYLERPKTPEDLRREASLIEANWVRSHWAEMSPKAKQYWGQRYPDQEAKQEQAARPSTIVE